MNEQIDENDNDDTQAHLYIPKDERTGGGADTEGHKRFRRIEEAGEGDVVTDTEGHKRYRRIEDAGEGDVVGHGQRAPGDPVNEPSAVRGRDAQGRR